MEIDFYINGVSEKSILSSGQLIVEKLNIEEEIFRTKTRFENNQYSHWIVFERKHKTLIINGEKLTINITRYLDKKTNKKFIFYHNEILKIMGKKRYWLSDVLTAIKTQNLRRRNPNQNEALKPKIPYDIYYYYLKKKYITFLVKNTKFLPSKNDVIQLENDDAYINLNKGKFMVRMVGFHSGYLNQNNHMLLNKTIILQFNKSQKVYQNIDILATKTSEILNNFYHAKTINLSGDGARIITKFSEQINAIRYYDKFHFHKILFDVFGYSKKKNKDNKRIFDNTFGNQFSQFLWFLNNKKYEDFENKLHENLIYLRENKLSAIKIVEIKSLIKLWKNNKNYLINSYENVNYYGGNAETFIGHYLKKYTKTAFSRHNIDYLKLKILLNIPQNLNVVFL